jgi:probable blue pigment (indigoidine) exporter
MLEFLVRRSRSAARFAEPGSAKFFRTYRSVLWLVASAACWGVGTVVSKRAVEEIAPLALLPMQLAVSVAALAVVTSVQQVPVRWSRSLRRLAAVGILNPGIAYVLSLMGLAHITASLSVLLWSIEPLLILVLAVAVLDERVTGRQATVMAVAVVGVVLLVFERGSGGPLGVALTLAGVTACAVYTVVSRRLMGADPALVVVLVQQSCALLLALGMVGVAGAAGWLPSLTTVSTTAWISAAVSGLIYYAAAFWCYLTALRGLPASAAGVFINLVPVFGLAAGYLMLGERLSGRQWLGAATVVAAVTVAALFQARSPAGGDVEVAE